MDWDASTDRLWGDTISIISRYNISEFREWQARYRELEQASEQLLHSDDSSEDEVSCLKLIYLNLIFIEKSVLYGVCELR